MDKLWFGALFIVNIQIAYLTPPFGFVLFWLQGVLPRDVSLGDIYRSVGPFVLLQLLGLILVFLFPGIAVCCRTQSTGEQGEMRFQPGSGALPRCRRNSDCGDPVNAACPCAASRQGVDQAG